MPLRYTFQDPVTPMMYGMSSLHDHMLFFLALILFVVMYIFVSTLFKFHYQYNIFNYFLGPVWNDYYKAVTLAFKKCMSDGSTRRYHKNGYFLWNWSSLNNGVFMEIVWTVMPSVMLLLIAIPSFALLFAIDEMTLGKLLVKVMGHQWYWSYEVSGLLSDVPFNMASFDSYMLADNDLLKGDLRLLKTDNALILPKNMPILALMTSDDVLHSWAIPSFGVKVDAVPGRLSQISLLLKNSGIFSGQCSELCGVNHGFMPIEMWVVDVNTFISLEVFLKKTLHL